MWTVVTGSNVFLFTSLFYHGTHIGHEYLTYRLLNIINCLLSFENYIDFIWGLFYFRFSTLNPTQAYDTSTSRNHSLTKVKSKFLPDPTSLRFFPQWLQSTFGDITLSRHSPDQVYQDFQIWSACLRKSTVRMM